MAEQNIISASVSNTAKNLHKKFREKGINFSRHVEQLILKLAKKNKIE